VSSAEARRRASRALSKSGTVTLELALAGVPTVVAHRVPTLTWWVGRWMVGGIHHLALPNILLDRQEGCKVGAAAPIPEYLQHFDAATLVAALRSVSPPPSDRLRRLLAPPDARSVAERAAAAIVERLSLPRSARR
jgi:lipid-A-disaccharide synthase